METAYGITGRTDVYSPGDEEQIKQVNHTKPNDRRNAFLFHLHGSVKNIRDNIESVILTTESYKKYYSNSSENEFLQSLSGVTILYLGIGLENQEPFLSFFRDKLPSGSHYYHFAVYSADTKVEAEKLHRQLEEQKIQALIYPKGKYAYVKYILEWLKKETPTREEIGQWEEEILDTEQPFRYAEVSGGSWIGKTRLAEELKKKAENKNWEVNFFNGKNIHSLTLPPNMNRPNTLYIFDDATIYNLKTEDKTKYCKYFIDLVEEKKKVRVVFIYTSLENIEKWWEEGIKNNCKVSPEIYFWSEIKLSLPEETAKDIIVSFAEHGNIAQKTDGEKIKRCFEFWRKLIAEKTLNVNPLINTPYGCMLLTAIFVDDEDEKATINKVRRSLIRKGLSENEADNILIWIKTYKDLFASQVDTGEAQLYVKKKGKQWPNKKA